MSEGLGSDGGSFDAPDAGRDDQVSGTRWGRRSLMLGAAAAGAGAVAGLAAGEPAGAANGGAVVLGASNSATALTSITSKKSTAFEGISTGKATENTDGVGVYGSSKNGYAVRGDSAGFYAGVGGYASAAGSSGVYGEGDGNDGYGVYASATGTGGTSIFAADSPEWALYSDGATEIIGPLSKPGGSFKIDHPTDPAGKYLYHSFVESPDMKNVYDGTVVLDGSGRATVELPEWFEALNRDFRYALTALDRPAPDLHISARVAEGKFSVAGGNAHQEVSWQVTGIRQDAWANANRIPTEVGKPEEDRGRYLHPELFGGEPITYLARARAQASQFSNGRHA